MASREAASRSQLCRIVRRLCRCAITIAAAALQSIAASITTALGGLPTGTVLAACALVAGPGAAFHHRGQPHVEGRGVRQQLLLAPLATLGGREGKGGEGAVWQRYGWT